MGLARILDYRIVHVTLEPGGAAGHEDRVIRGLAGIAEVVTPDTYAVVATMGKYDETALAHLARTPAAYVGLVASRRRAAAVLEALREAGVEEAARARIQSPAGLDLSAETPEEIALSILAQIVQVCRTAGPRELPVSADRKPDAMETDAVCGMQVDRDSPIRATHAGRVFLFCSEGCRTRFVKAPEAYARATP
jgi:xanthine dehydrogenase accessory factor